MSCNNKRVETPLPALQMGEVASKAHKLGQIFEVASRSEAGGGVFTSDPIHNYEHPGVRLFINITDPGAGGTLTVKIQNQAPDGSWVDVPEAVTTALAAAAHTTLTLYPGIEEDANVSISNPLGLVWRVHATVAVNAVVFGLGADYLC